MPANFASAQDTHNWDSVGRLRPGDQVRISLTAPGRVEGQFQRWTPEEILVSDVSHKRQEVLRLERYRSGGWSRGKRAAVGALIGFGGGFAIGAAVGSNCGQGWGLGPCYSRGAFGAGMGGTGALVGAVIGAALPNHRRELIYTAK